MEPLPDFLRLSDDEAAREKERQARLRTDFNSRVRLSPVREEMARAQILEESLRTALRNAKGSDKKVIANRLADNLAAQGRFDEASATAAAKESRAFYRKVAKAVFEGSDCECEPQIAAVGQTRIQLPRYRVIKQIYSLKDGTFGFLVECSSCKQWSFVTNNPLPTPVNPNDFDIAKTPNDLTRLRI